MLGFCTRAAFVAFSSTLTLAAQVTWTQLALPVQPPARRFICLTVYLQAWTLQPGHNTMGIVTSNGLALTVGDL